MNPYLVDLGIFQISWYSIFILFGLFIGGTLLVRESKKFKINEEFIYNMIFWITIFGIIGARSYYVAFNWDYYQNNLIDVIKIWEGGLAIHGAILFGLIFLFFYTLKYKVNFARILDMIVPSLIIGQVVGRWGNFVNQEAYGSEVSREFLSNLFIPDFIIEGMKIAGVYHHPTFLYESLWCLLGFIVILIVRKSYKYLKLGQLTGIYLMWYSFGRFFIEGLRMDSLMLGELKMAQIISVILFLIGLMIVSVRSTGSKFEGLYKERDNNGEIRF